MAAQNVITIVSNCTDGQWCWPAKPKALFLALSLYIPLLCVFPWQWIVAYYKQELQALCPGHLWAVLLIRSYDSWQLTLCFVLELCKHAHVSTCATHKYGGVSPYGKELSIPGEIGHSCVHNPARCSASWRLEELYCIFGVGLKWLKAEENVSGSSLYRFLMVGHGMGMHSKPYTSRLPLCALVCDSSHEP